MPNTPCNAFLQSHVRPVAVPLTCGARLIPGTKVGVWRIDGEPHWARRSATYPVMLEGSGDRAVMTVFDAPALHLGSYPRRILSIAQRLAAVEHPGVASVVDAGLTADGRPYVVTDLEQAVPLTDCLAGMERLRALTLLRAICAPLLAAHDLGIAHGSLELEHVFLIESDAHYVKVIDWGIERAVFDEAERAGLASEASATIAPEAALGMCSPQMDAYALGAIAQRLLGADMPLALVGLVRELMAEDPRQRPTLRNAAERLGAIQRELEMPAIAAPVMLPAPVPAVIQLQPRRSWRAAVGCAALAAAAAVSFVCGPHGLLRSTGASTASIAVTPSSESIDSALPSAALRAPARPGLAIALATSAVAAVAEPIVTAPVIEDDVAAPIVEAARVVKAVVKAPSVRRPRLPALDDAKRNELLAQYQRIGRALFELQSQRGVAATSELMQQFKQLKIEPAMATHESRAAAAATLGDLRSRLERQRGVTVADACLKNALADGCR